MSCSDGQLYTSPWPGCSTSLILSNAHRGIVRGIFVDVVNTCNQLTLSKGDYPPGLWVGLIQSIERAWEQNWDFSEDKDCLKTVSSLPTCPASLRLASPYSHASQFLEINCMYILYIYIHICVCIIHIHVYMCVLYIYIYTYICVCIIYMCVYIYIWAEREV